MFFRRKKEAAPTFEQRLEEARARGFSVETLSDGASRFRLARGECAAVVEPGGFIERPGLLADGEIAKLVDRGYQKFLVTSKATRPALAEQLRAIHQFGKELRRILNIPSLYNESLGTVSNRYVYDRVEGREN